MMFTLCRWRLAFAAALVAAPLHLPAADPAPAVEKSPADYAFERVLQAWRAEKVEPLTTFYTTLGVWLEFPNDARAFDARMLNNMPHLSAMAGMEPQEAELFGALMTKRLTELAGRMDVPEAARGKFREMLASQLGIAIQGSVRGKNPDWRSVRADFDRLTVQYPTSKSLWTTSLNYAGLLESEATDESIAELNRLAASPVQTVAQIASGKLRALASTREPMEMSFVSFEGRKVDLAQLRGKIVLVDFWATWCVPCVAEMPNVRAVYDKYHARGFEVVGISLDSEADKLRAFLKEKAVPWPNHFDGKGYDNEFARRYALGSVPAMFLLGPDGKVVTRQARGPKLEEEVSRLLGLQTAR